VLRQSTLNRHDKDNRSDRNLTPRPLGSPRNRTGSIHLARSLHGWIDSRSNRVCLSPRRDPRKPCSLRDLSDLPNSNPRISAITYLSSLRAERSNPESAHTNRAEEKRVHAEAQRRGEGRQRGSHKATKTQGEGATSIRPAPVTPDQARGEEEIGFRSAKPFVASWLCANPTFFFPLRPPRLCVNLLFTPHPHLPPRRPLARA
jgi:hypothetical protein